MCGINGFNFKDDALIERMNEVTRHRGPDDTGFLTGAGFSVGNNRLAIIDVSPRGHQPMESRDKRLALVYNGELYNFKELRRELEQKGYVFTSETDTEVVLAAYETWGIACLKKFDGIFAFAVVHKDTGKIVLARDRFGVNPLYYYHNGGVFIFSSEAKAIFAHGVTQEINPDALNFYARLFYVPSPLTMWRFVHKLPPAHCAVFEHDSLTIERYWELGHVAERADKEGIKHDIKMAVDAAVRKQLISDRPVGLFLSGGIDSTVVCGAMHAAGGRVETFSVGFEETEEAEKYNRDFELARLTSTRFGTVHHELVLSGKDIAANFERAVYHLDEPISNHIQVVNLLLAEEAVKHVAVVLGGDGGDEVWGGYDRYYFNQLIDKVRKVPTFVRENLLRHALRLQGREEWYEKFTLPPGVERYFSFWGAKEPVVAQYLKVPYNNHEVVHQFFAERYFKEIWHNDFTKQMMLTDLSTWLPDESLVRSNKMSMAVGLEQRVPLLDQQLVELGFSVPTRFKISGKGNGKTIFKEALKDYLSPQVLEQKKWGWFSPAAKWLRTDLNAFAREVLSEGYNAATAEYFDFNVAQRMLEDHVAKRGYHLNTLWALMTFQVWYRKMMK